MDYDAITDIKELRALASARGIQVSELVPSSRTPGKINRNFKKPSRLVAELKARDAAHPEDHSAEEAKQSSSASMHPEPSTGPKKPGYVYILVNQDFRGKVKIGKTSGDPKRRARQLTTTGHIHPFEVYAVLKTRKFDAVEELVHRTLTKLTSKRVVPNREFYQIKPAEALEILKDVSIVLDEDDREVIMGDVPPPSCGKRPVKPIGETWTGKTALAKIIARRGGNEGAFGGLLLLFSRKRHCVKTSKWRQLLSDAGIKFDENDFVIDWRSARNPL